MSDFTSNDDKTQIEGTELLVLLWYNTRVKHDPLSQLRETVSFTLLLLLLLVTVAVFSQVTPQGRQITTNLQTTILPHAKSTPTETPSTQIQQLATAAGMTAKGQQIFYAAHPQIDTDRKAFEKHCQVQSTSDTVELGCYTTDGHIYLLAIDDPDLKNEMIVTAAHEMLHAAYEQVSPSNKTKLNGELETQLTTIPDTKLSKSLESYRQTEPGQRDNELHSILGTEYANLSEYLESYYSQLFTDRSIVVGYATAYNKVFSDLEAAIKDLEQKIQDTKAQMDVYEKNNDAENYNALVPVVNGYIDQYNEDVEKYNQLSRTLMGTQETETTTTQSSPTPTQ